MLRNVQKIPQEAQERTDFILSHMICNVCFGPSLNLKISSKLMQLCGVGIVRSVKLSNFGPVDRGCPLPPPQTYYVFCPISIRASYDLRIFEILTIFPPLLSFLAFLSLSPEIRLISCAFMEYGLSSLLPFSSRQKVLVHMYTSQISVVSFRHTARLSNEFGCSVEFC